jgi:inorganic pyrophosphatase
MDRYLKEYVEQLSDIEKTVLKIAQAHLETSFSLEKSIGFKEWYAKKKH